ncbi:MAG: rRNA pseudouridine synthase [Flavobacteriales bacterium]|nr:rRNA pseudouridine synthase [Flavobacteriales bacterium]
MEKKFNSNKFQGKKTVSFSKDKPKIVSKEKRVIEKSKSTTSASSEQDIVRLNRFIANAGICSRREADTLISEGVVEINGKIVTELGTKVKLSDVVKVNGKKIEGEKKQYLLLNKPKDYITTMDDPKDRKTVLDLVGKACMERVYPVGRLDRATTGLLLFTNDGEMTKKLTHPSSNIKKVYQVSLDKNVTQKDMMRLVEGVELEDGVVAVDKVMYAKDGVDKSIITLDLHSGKNRVIRRMMEQLNYKVLRLDRIQFAGLTKKDIPRGRFRFLTEKEIGFLHRITGIKQQS